MKMPPITSATRFLILLIVYFLLSENQSVKAQDYVVKGLVAQWKLNENQGNIATESKNVGFNAKLVNTNWITGVNGSAVLFNGSSSNLDFPFLYNDSFPKSGSLSFWIKGDFSNQNNQTIFDGYRSGFNHIFIRSNSATNGIQIAFQKVNTSYSFLSLVPISPNVWTHIAIVWDTRNHFAFVYKNGIYFTSGPIVDNYTKNSRFPLDAWTNASQKCLFGNGFIGGLDNIALFNRVLSPTEIKYLVDPVSTPIPVQDSIKPSTIAQIGSCSNTKQLNSLTWNRSTEQDVVGYIVYKNGLPLSFFAQQISSFIDTTLIPGEAISYSLKSFDSSGNASDLAILPSIQMDTLNLYLQSNFDGESISSTAPLIAWDEQSPNNNSIQITNEISRNGKQSLKFVLNKNEWNANSLTTKRAEILSNLQGPSEFKLGQTSWLGFSTYIPLDWVSDFPDNQETIWQFHGATNGPGSNSPPLAAHIVGDSIQIKIRNGITPSLNGNEFTIASFPIIKGKWIDWVLNVNFSYTAGKIQIWKNCEMVVDYNGANIYAFTGQTNENGPYVKFGIYKWNWGTSPTKVSSRVIYVDEIKIGKSVADFNIIKPLGDNSCKFPTIISSYNQLGFWPLNDGEVNKTIFDYSSFKRNGISNNLQWDSTIISNPEAIFKGNSSINFSQIDTTSFPKSGSLSFWIYGDFKSQSNQNIFDGYRNSNHIFIRTNSNISGIQIAFQNTVGAYCFFYNLPIPSNSWSQIGITWDVENKMGYVYLNGKLVFSNPIYNNALLSGAALKLGNWLPSGQKFFWGGGFVGKLKQILLYDKILNSDEFKSIYSNTLFPSPDITPPTIPSVFRASALTPKEIAFNYGGSNDGPVSKIAGYLFKKNGIPNQVFPAVGYRYIDTGLVSNTNYSYSLQAFDYSGLQSTPVALSINTNPDQLVFKGDFEADQTETGSIINGWQKSGANPATVNIVSDRTRNGDRALKDVFNLADWTLLNPKNEISSSYAGPAQFVKDKTWWIGFSELIEAAWKNETPGNTDIIWRFKGATNGPGSTSDLLYALVDGDSIRIFLQAGNTINGTSKQLASVLKTNGNWMDWVVQVNFSYTNGLINIWQNCEKIVSYTGSTLYPISGQTNENGPSLILGLFKNNWNSNSSTITSRTVFIDEIRVANELGNYATVKPNGLNACGADVPLGNKAAILYWDANDANSTKVTDKTGNGYFGSASNLGLEVRDNAYALNFNNKSAQVSNAELGNSGFPKNGTLSFWIKGDFENMANATSIFDSYRMGADHIFIRSNNVQKGIQIAFQKANANYAFHMILPIDKNVWTFITIVWDIDSQYGKVFKNGVLMQSERLTDNALVYMSPQTEKWVPTNQNFVFGNGFIGSMDDVLLNATVLSWDDIFTLYSQYLNSSNSLVPLQILRSNLTMDAISASSTKQLKVHAYPNPTNGNFKMEFNSSKKSNFTLRIYDGGNLKLLKESKIDAVEGLNKYLVNLDLQQNTHFLILKLFSNDVIFNPVKIMCINK